MNYLIVTDIFGITAHLAHFSRLLSAKTQIIDPYNAQLQSPVNEQLQYAKFINECGHDGYLDKTLNALNNLEQPTIVIAFSAGGTAAWRAQAHQHNPYIKKVVAFYPGQIRHFLALDAKIPCEFIFPKEERHFELTPVVIELKSKEYVSCERTLYQHGFMNPLSVGFNNQAYKKYSEQLLNKEVLQTEFL